MKPACVMLSPKINIKNASKTPTPPGADGTISPIIHASENTEHQ